MGVVKTLHWKKKLGRSCFIESLSNNNYSYKLISYTGENFQILAVSNKIVVYLTSLCVNWVSFHSRAKKGPIYTRTS
jgi:hypothetical protein